MDIRQIRKINLLSYYAVRGLSRSVDPISVEKSATAIVVPSILDLGTLPIQVKNNDISRPIKAWHQLQL